MVTTITTPHDGKIVVSRLTDGRLKLVCRGPRGGFHWFYILSEENESELLEALQCSTYLIAEVRNTGDWGIIEEFQSKDDEAANAYAEKHCWLWHSHIEWYVLYQSTQVNING